MRSSPALAERLISSTARARGGVALFALAAALSMSEAGNRGGTARAAGVPEASPSAPESEVALARLSAIDRLVADAIAHNKLPGCVVVIGRRDRVLYHRAFGMREVEPDVEAMTEDTIFDLASLTKPIATATSIVILAEHHRLGLDDKASRYVPEFGARGKDVITIRQLLTHVSGLPAETPFDDYEHGREEAIRRISAVSLKAPPGTKFIYSDIGYIILEEIIRRVSGKDLATFTHDAIFGPLGMTETEFLLSPEMKRRAAPTERREGGDWIRGDVHDPRAFRLGGIAGHAGLFSTAKDLTRYAQMLLSGGALGGARILSRESVAKLMAPHDVPGGIRALGWDVMSAYSANRGTALSRRAVGHGGYTGTALWIDPEENLFVLFLSNRVHPDGKGSVNALAGQIGTVAGEALGQPEDVAAVAPSSAARSSTASSAVVAAAVVPTAPAGGSPSAAVAATGRSLADTEGHSGGIANRVLLGIDVLASEGYAPLRGAHLGLLTNDGARSSDGERTVDLLAGRKDLSVVALFTPEHGLGANREEAIADGFDPRWHLPIYSLYGKTTAPTPPMLAGIDTMVVDLPDVGARFYTYASTLHATMRVVAAQGLRMVLLDRPNPIDGVDVAGPVLKMSEQSFVNHHPLPVRHGMTLGELAEMIDADEHLGTRLEIVRMRSYDRHAYFEKTGLAWHPPSPNLRTVDEVVLYPGVALVEGTNVSVGRGTDTPFEVVGAPWIDGERLAATLSADRLDGVTFAPIVFTPTASRYAGVACHGIHLRVDDRTRFEPVRTGVAIALALRKLYPAQWDASRLHQMIGDPAVTAAILASRPLVDIEALWKDELDTFRSKRLKYLLYPP